jgi:hypothetical protein
MEENDTKILRAFEDHAWMPSKEKIQIELDPVVNRFSSLMSSEKWNEQYLLLRRRVKNGKGIFLSNYFRPLEDIKKVVSKLMLDGFEYILAFISEYYNQFKSFLDDQAKQMNEALSVFLQQNIIMQGPEFLEACENCEKIQITSKSNSEEKCECGSRLFRVFKSTLNDSVRKSLLNNQFIEVFARDCMRDAGLKLISKKTNGARVSTSIQYNVPPIPVEIDVAAVKRGRVFVCECKTNTVTPNDIAIKLSHLQRLVKSIETETGKLKVIYCLLSTEEIDKNIQPQGYRSSHDWLEDLIRVQGQDVSSLKERLQEYASTLS